MFVWLYKQRHWFRIQILPRSVRKIFIHSFWPPIKKAPNSGFTKTQTAKSCRAICICKIKIFIFPFYIKIIPTIYILIKAVPWSAGWAESKPEPKGDVSERGYWAACWSVWQFCWLRCRSGQRIRSTVWGRESPLPPASAPRYPMVITAAMPMPPW